MNINFISNIRIPTEKAHGFQISKMCEELSNAGAVVELWVPDRNNTIQQDLFSYYSLKQNFKVRYVSCFDFLKYAFYLKSLAFIFQNIAFIKALKNIPIAKETIIYSRNSEIINYYANQGYTTIYDAHSFPTRRIKKFLKNIEKVSGIVCNSDGTAQQFKNQGFSKVLSIPNAVDLSDFLFDESKVDLRNKLVLPQDKKIIMYVGHLYSWKGIDTIVEAAKISRDPSCYFVCVGGTKEDIEKYRSTTKNLNNILFLGHKLKQQIPLYIKSADVLLLPNVPINDESKYYTSPIKMFEYMASNVPIVASDLPSIKEILNEKNAILVKPGDAENLLDGLNKAMQHDASYRAKQAFSDVQNYTWNKRAKSILNFITSCVDSSV